MNQNVLTNIFSCREKRLRHGVWAELHYELLHKISELQHNVDQFEIDAELIALSTKTPVMPLSMPKFMNAM